jgi:UDP-N-acetyl-D-glucosamine dehydrogenase
MNAPVASKDLSVSPLTGDGFALPHETGDRERVDRFLDANAGRPVVVVQGLGFVGAVMSLVCANAIDGDYAVIGVDLPTRASYWKIESINAGRFPVVASDRKIEAFYRDAMRKGNLLATFDPYAYSKADVIVVDVNLDVRKISRDGCDLVDFDVDLSAFRAAVTAIGEHCREDVLILVETTVPPGTCDRIVRPLIARCLRERGLATDRFRLGHSYERVMPGPDYIDSIQSFYRVYSGVDDASADATERFLRTIVRTDEYPLTRLGGTTATEMAKVLENSYRAANIAFMVEWSRFAEDAGVNLYEVVQAIRMRPTHRNMMLPGIGVGGYCLTKDPLLASWARRSLFGSPEGLEQSVQGVRINDRMPVFAYEFLRRWIGDRHVAPLRVLLLGVSYRSDVGDTRFSPVEGFYRCLVRDGCRVALHDYFVPFWEETGQPVAQDLDGVLEDDHDVIAITTAHSAYRDVDGLVERLLRLRRATRVLDTLGLLTASEIERLSRLHAVKVVGRGDLA